MNRHLHNTLSALSISGALLVLGLIGAAPLMPGDTGMDQMTRVATTPTTQAKADSAETSDLDLITEAVAVAMLADAIGQASSHTIDTAPPRPIRKSQRERRQTLVMPYLSFLPRG